MLRILLAVLVLAAGLVALVLAFSARDDSQIAAAPAGPGELQPDRGAAHDGPAGPGGLPTSGPHRPDLVPRDRRQLTNDQLIHALELGNVVLVYDASPGALEAVQQEVSGPFDAELAAAGQAVILMRRPGTPTAALAWRRILETDDPAALREFAEAWLGRGVS